MNIIDEIADWQTLEIEAGRNPSKIPLSDDQKSRLMKWIKSFDPQMKRLDGSRILGMDVI